MLYRGAFELGPVGLLKKLDLHFNIVFWARSGIYISLLDMN